MPETRITVPAAIAQSPAVEAPADAQPMAQDPAEAPAPAHDAQQDEQPQEPAPEVQVNSPSDPSVACGGAAPVGEDADMAGPPFSTCNRC